MNNPRRLNSSNRHILTSFKDFEGGLFRVLLINESALARECP